MFVCSSVHGFVQTTDLELNEGATQEVITMMLDVKGNTILEPTSTRVRNFDFSFTCIDRSYGGGPMAVGELWTCKNKLVVLTTEWLPWLADYLCTDRWL